MVKLPYWIGFNSGREMRTLRKRAGFTQAKLAAATGYSRNLVYLYEAKAGQVSGRAPAAFRSAIEAKGVHVPAPGERLIDDRPTGWPAPRTCRAKTRHGTPCKCKPCNPLANGRCKFHGGKSTGPKTTEGRQRISLAMKARHQQRRLLAGRPLEAPAMDLIVSPPAMLDDIAARVAQINRALGRMAV